MYDRTWWQYFMGGMAASFVCAAIYFTYWDDGILNAVANASKGKKDEATIVFVGDIMLGRNVEQIAKEEGWPHIFKHVDDIFEGADAVIGNLEGVIQRDHTQTPTGAMRFSFDPNVAQVLEKYGVTHVDLANNHALDFGTSGYFETRAFLEDAGIDWFGDPRNRINAQTFTIEGNDIALIGILGLEHFDRKELMETIEEAKDTNDVVVVSFHWGEEYETDQSAWQEKLAHEVIDAGADAVISHHPHVVQGIETYKGKLIAYSLGNFIFDQYFSKDTQESLAIRMHIDGDEITYEFIPLKSERSVVRRDDE